MNDHTRVHRIEADDEEQKYRVALQEFAGEEVKKALVAIDTDEYRTVRQELLDRRIKVGTNADISSVLRPSGGEIDPDFYPDEFGSILEIRGFVALRTASARIHNTWITEREILQSEAEILTSAISKLEELPPNGLIRREFEPTLNVSLWQNLIDSLAIIEESIAACNTHIENRVGGRNSVADYDRRVAIAALDRFLRGEGCSAHEALGFTAQILSWWGLVTRDPEDHWEMVKSALRSKEGILADLDTKRRPRTTK